MLLIHITIKGSIKFFDHNQLSKSAYNTPIMDLEKNVTPLPGKTYEDPLVLLLHNTSSNYETRDLLKSS